MVQVVMMMNWHVWNRQSVKKSYQGLVDEMSLEFIPETGWVIESGTIRCTGYGFLLVFYSNFVPKTHYF